MNKKFHSGRGGVPVNHSIKDEFSKELKKQLDMAATSIMKVEKGTFLFQEGMSADELHVIKTGRVQVSKISSDGKELSLRFCSGGDIVGEFPIFTSKANYSATAKVLENGEVAVIKKEILEMELYKNSRLALQFIKWMYNNYGKNQTKIRDLVLYGKKGALYSTIIRMTNDYGIIKENGDIVINFVITNQELANFCGTTRESVNRMLSELCKNDIVSISKGEITVHDLNHLKREINCEDCPIEYCSIK